METLNILPALDPRSRFGTISIGYDRIDTIRTEHSALASLAGLLMGRDDVAKVKATEVGNFRTEIEQRVAYLTAAEGQFSDAVDEIVDLIQTDPKAATIELLAWAVVFSKATSEK